MSEIPLKAKVICRDGEAGITSAVIIDPSSERITHVVVETRRYLDYLVPVELIAGSDDDTLTLSCTLEELQKLPAFTETHFVQEDMVDDEEYMGVQYLTPYVTAVRATGGPIEEEQVPAGELAIHRGTDVYAADGHIGVLEEFVVDPETGKVSHIVLRKGHLWGRREMAIPLSAIERTEYDAIHLKMGKDELENLPGVTIQRKYKGGE
jgi:sporulation protein YlmC with PRC-barrel domain